MAGKTIGSSIACSEVAEGFADVRGALQLQQFCWVEKLFAPHAGHNRLSLDIFPNRYDALAQQTWNRHQNAKYRPKAFGPTRR